MSDEHLYNHIYLSPLIKPTKEQRELCRPYEDIYMSHCKQSVVESHLKSELLCGNARRSLKKCLETDGHYSHNDWRRSGYYLTD
jgi:hypothetical protein